MRWAPLLLLAGCGVVRGPLDTSASDGVDSALVRGCVDCHHTVGETWSREFSHSLLFDCSQCHLAVTRLAGTRHMSTRECSTCHSETLHKSQPCAVCHDPHGSPNAYLVRARLFQGPVSFTSPEGLSPGGLVHSDGTGICERCHTKTKYARADGAGAAHPATWCPDCHSHQTHFTAR